MSQMKTVHIKKDDRFEPLVIKPKKVALGHQHSSIGTGIHTSKKHKKDKNRNFLREWTW